MALDNSKAPAIRQGGKRRRLRIQGEPIPYVRLLSMPSPLAAIPQSKICYTSWLRPATPWASSPAVASEQLTVKGGTFQTTKFSGKSTSAGSSFDATFWVSDEVGLIKSITKGTAAAGAYALQQTLPGGFQMPAGISLPAAGAGGVGTAPVSMQIETVTELVGLKR
jgi:hypothetical protein